MALLLQLNFELLEIIDLAILDNPYGGVFVVDRLVPGNKVYDSKPAYPKPDLIPAVYPVIIRPPPGQNI